MGCLWARSAAAGVGLIAVLGHEMIRQPWLLVALSIYFVNLAIAFFIQRPSLRRLVGIRASADDRAWTERARRQRYLSYLMAGLVGTIGATFRITIPDRAVELGARRGERARA